MAKTRKRPAGKSRASAPPPVRASSGQGRRTARAADAKAAPPVLSTGMSLLAEIERLQGELGATRARLAEIEAKANIDPLLDIFNRRGFERELKRALAYVKRYGTRAALIYLDLDNFKPVNDGHGHAAGDAVLKAVAHALLHNVRASDTVARVGGDEFALLLWNLQPGDAEAKAAALEDAVAGLEIPFGVKSLSVGASAGFTMIEPLDDGAAVLTRADQAMYRRKAARKFSPAIAPEEHGSAPRGQPAPPPRRKGRKVTR